MTPTHLIFFFQQFNSSTSSSASTVVTVGRVSGFVNQTVTCTVVV